MIGGHVREIDVTSPTGLQEVNRLDEVDLEPRTWDGIEARYAETADPANPGRRHQRWIDTDHSRQMSDTHLNTLV